MDPAREIVATEGLRPLSRSEYDRLVELGAFEDDAVELLYGVIVPMSPRGPRHAATVARLTRVLLAGIGARAEIRTHSPFAASEVSEPEPDLAVVPVGDWDLDHPGSAHLLIEVSASSQRRDRGPKLRLYAAAGVPEYWLVDLESRAVEVYTEPADGHYRTLRTVGDGDTLAPSAFPDVVLRVGSILPRS